MRRNCIYSNLTPIRPEINLYELGITFCLSEDREYVDIIDKEEVVDGVRYVKVIYTTSHSSKNEVMTVNHMVTRKPGENVVRVDFDELVIPAEQYEQVDILRDKLKFITLALTSKGNDNGSGSSYNP
ncbi:hypothetical protein [Fulvivirga sedimenti]|uniref:Uncharacterized protein n=1 Tax=Fulvivirga sedimenti TaxID=2879465 RepID=A0A9X1HV09_9BACT|nr:hypothetical protein [Fulvivirga sedimenti]MCA6078804.1 hypothetical protein [Fulvivirga sedimenti]